VFSGGNIGVGGAANNASGSAVGRADGSVGNAGGAICAKAEAPRALTLVHFPCGRMLFGQAVFVPADFTGQRAAFFMHNFILEPIAAVDALDDMEKLLNTRFETSWDINGGCDADAIGILPKEIAESPVAKSPTPLEQSVSNATIAHIMHCAVEAVEKSKKVYILLPYQAGQLNKSVSQVHGLACDLLVKIYATLPEPFRHILGFCTYTREPEKRKNIHLIFLDSEAYYANKQRFHGNAIIDLNAEGLSDGVDTAGNGASLDCTRPTHSSEVLSYTYEEFLTKKFATLSVRQLFAEGDFWRVRTPAMVTTTATTNICTHDLIARLEAMRLNTLLDTLTMQDFFTTPDSIIRKRKDCRDAAVFVIFSIIKQACTNILAKKPFSLRYLLGSYTLSKEDYVRAVSILRKFYTASNNGGNLTDENVAFLDSLK